MIRNHFNYNETCETNKKVEETSFVSHIIYALICLNLLKLLSIIKYYSKSTIPYMPPPSS